MSVQTAFGVEVEVGRNDNLLIKIRCFPVCQYLSFWHFYNGCPGLVEQEEFLV